MLLLRWQQLGYVCAFEHSWRAIPLLLKCVYLNIYVLVCAHVCIHVYEYMSINDVLFPCC